MTSHTAAGTAPIGIDDIELATSHHVVSLDDFAAANGTDPNKFRLGLGQDEFSFPAPDEDVVTMAAAAAAPIIRRSGSEGIRTLLFATESGIDQSKAAGMAVHSLLDLPSQMRVVEVKEACYSATAALQAAVGIVTRSPGQRVLVIASDVARYEIDTPGEPTQGAGAVAMLVSADPKLLEIEPVSGLNSAEVDDFWRPNDSTTAIVDGALSVTAYLDSLTGAWTDLAAQGGPAMAEIDRVLYHQPFTKMAKKAQVHLAELTGEDLETEIVAVTGAGADAAGAGAATAAGADAVGASDAGPTGPRDTGLATSTLYNRRLGNSYTASLYAGLCSLLDHDEDLAGKRIGFFSYGSGSVGEFFTTRVVPGYEQHSRRQAVTDALDARVPLSIDAYRALHATELSSADDVTTPKVTAGPFRFAGIKGGARLYERA
ncbi:hydroxymethylglutaryl-CoA synthase family protein [Brevibacterium linens]|uniref:Hydroxymethylglutaryl-CoA synthase n=1 Tax=Brevibacterium linens ATCC 9172 TaxID=1255617 RepID=A0A2H1JHI6_BRELN|nr:hydroxymethylglutaryl-CoA synthase [Brevibacterium linens]KAB1947764.1 hydroxymethylglutaryl-CoA synthase [Brevibacterium linens ATCC 9172]SMX86873.1 hydroxymethylglutaryl-CoA synthase [Brevibacterium linens ATCC 9172]